VSEVVIGRVTVRFFTRGYIELFNKFAPPFKTAPNQTLLLPKNRDSIEDCIEHKEALNFVEFTAPVIEVTVETVSGASSRQVPELIMWSWPLAKIARDMRPANVQSVSFLAMWEHRFMDGFKLLGRVDESRLKRCVAR
jgi:hypothetical protein